MIMRILNGFTVVHFLVTVLLMATGFLSGYLLASEEIWLTSVIGMTQSPAIEIEDTVYNMTIRSSNNHTLLLKSLLANRKILKSHPSSSAMTSSTVTSAMRTGQITARFMGGIGNQMFEYAALVGAAKMNNLVPFIKKADLLSRIFEIGEPTVFEEEADFSKYNTIGEPRGCAYDRNLEHLDLKGGKAELLGYRQSWKYFIKYNETVRKHFAFNSAITKEGIDVLTNLKGSRENVTFVAIHIRRGDILVDPFKSFGYLVADEQYFNKSMTYFRKKYNNVQFIVCSNGMDWSKKALNAVNDDVTFVEGKQPEVDLAIMSHCDHTIMSVGSFGWWASWLAGGEVIYYTTPAKPGSNLAAQFDYADYYPANWIGMT